MLQAVLWCSELCSQRSFFAICFVVAKNFMDYELKVKNVNGMENAGVFFYLINHKLAADLSQRASLTLTVCTHSLTWCQTETLSWSTLIFRSSGDVDASFQNSLMCVPDWKSEFLVWQWWWHCVCLWAGISQMCVSIPPACQFWK